MKLHLDIGHPAHVHLFKNFVYLMQQRGHVIYFTLRDKEDVVNLMVSQGFEFKVIGRHYDSTVGKMWGFIKFNVIMVKIARKEKPDIFLSHGSIYTLLSSLLFRIPNISLEDTGNKEQVALYRCFTRAIITSKEFRHNYGGKQIRYNGCHELAYLHPLYFTPDSSIINDLGIRIGEKYFIVRFVAWHASHDLACSGLSIEIKHEIVMTLQKYGRVYISSESPLPDDLSYLKFPLPPARMHDALAFAHMYVGEGATMASEASILGTPAVYINPLEADSINELAQYGLVNHLRSSNGIIDLILKLLRDTSIKSNAVLQSQKYIEGKIDLTAFLVWFIETWPLSFKSMKKIA